MGIRYAVLPDLDLTIVRWRGEIRLEQWLEHLARLIADPSYARTRMHVTDIRFASLDPAIGEAEMRRVVDFLRARPALFENRRVAVLAANEFPRARLFEQLAQALKVGIIVFNDLSPACRWLGVDLARVEAGFRGLDGLPEPTPRKPP